MIVLVDDEGMFALFLGVGFVVLAVLSLLFGADSRHHEPERHHPNLP